LHATKKAAVANQIFFATAQASTKEKTPGSMPGVLFLMSVKPAA
jgi:hypothetical protein